MYHLCHICMYVSIFIIFIYIYLFLCIFFVNPLFAVSFCFFFFFNQKTPYEMRISDWSSDVCSSDLEAAVERLLECVDLVDPLADDRALAEQVLVHVGHRARVRIDARLAAVQARVPRARPAAHARADPRLQDSVAAADHPPPGVHARAVRSEEHTSELQSLMRISYAVFCLKKKKSYNIINNTK